MDSKEDRRRLHAIVALMLDLAEGNGMALDAIEITLGSLKLSQCFSKEDPEETQEGADEDDEDEEEDPFGITPQAWRDRFKDS